MREKNMRFMKIYIWVLTGIFFAAGVGLLKIGGTLDVQNPMNQERIYDFSGNELTTSSETWIYDAQSGVFVVQGDKAGKNFASIPYNGSWNYLNLNISRMNADSSEWTLIFLDKANHKLGQQVITVANGENLIPLTYNESFRKLRIRIRNQSGLVFSIDAMQFRMNTVGFSAEVFLPAFRSALTGYIVISLLVFLFCHIKGRDAIEVLQFAYTLPGNYLGSRMRSRLSDRSAGFLRTILFMILFLVVPVMNISGNYFDSSLYKYGILASAVLLALIALLAWEKPLQQVKWSGILPAAWFMLWGWSCLSDLFVDKYFKYTGYVFLTAVGFFFFMWNNMNRPKRMMNQLIRGLELTFPIMLVYCLICRKRYVGILYNGAFSNREDMSLYVLAVLIAFLSELHFALVRRKICHRRKRIILYGIGVSLCVYFLYRANTLTCVCAGGFVILLFVIRLVQKCRTLPLGKAKSLGMLALAMVCSVGAVLAVNRTNMYLPDLLDTNIVYENEQWETNLSAAEMAEIEAMVPGYFNDVKHTDEAERNMIWTSYLRKINLLGNESARVRVSKEYVLCGNGLLEMAYRYGVFVLIPYTLLLLSCLYRSWKERGYLMLAVTLAFGIVLLTQNVEQPFLQPLWMLFYLGMGSWFKEEDETERLTVMK